MGLQSRKSARQRQCRYLLDVSRFSLSSKKLGIAIPLGDGVFLLLLTVIGIFGKLYKNLNSRRARPAQIFAPARD